MNSPMNPFSAGSPIDESAAMRNSVGVHRHLLRQAAVVRDHARVAPLVDDADEEEERAGGDAVVDHLEDRAARCPSGSARTCPA